MACLSRTILRPATLAAFVLGVALPVPARAADAAPAMPAALAAPAAAAVQAAVTSGTASSDIYAEFVGKRISHGLRSQKKVALTFDDGPHPTNTPQIIEMLKKAGAKATFFELGQMIDKHPEITKAIHDAGFEVADHSRTHPDLTKLGTDKIESEVGSTADQIEQVTGQRPRLFRPPYGNVNKNVTEVARKDGMVMVLWSVDTNDWRSTVSADEVVANIKKNVKNGDIILMHDIHSKELTALPQTLQYLKEAGYEMVTVSELLRAEAEAPLHEKESDTEPGPTINDAMGASVQTAAPSAPMVMSLDESAGY